MNNDETFMGRALLKAKAAARRGEVPVGAVIVRKGRIVASASNRMERSGRVTAHAELLALQSASRQSKSWRLSGHTIYVTLEPCPMCAAALSLARVDRIVFGAADPLAGACGSAYNIPSDGCLKARPKTTAGVRAAECALLLKEFFKKRRRKRRGAGAVEQARLESV